MRKWGFKGQPATHGHSKSHRSRGSSGGAAGSMFRTRIWKGKRNAGRMGKRTRTVKGLLVWKVVPKYNLVYLMGSVPGSSRQRRALDPSAASDIPLGHFCWCLASLPCSLPKASPLAHP